MNYLVGTALATFNTRLSSCTGELADRKGRTIVESVLTEWLSLIVRWLHVVAGIAWIGSSFYFIHLDLSLKHRSGLPEGVKGDAWQVHGGGFYHMVKYLVAPTRMPDELTWFKWEAYATWLSGFALLVIVYYLGAELYLIDKSVLDLTASMAAVVAFGSLLRRLAALRGAVPLPARPARGRARAGGLRLPRRAHLRLHTCVQRARRLHPDRRADRHHHGGERVRHRHPQPEEDRGCAACRQGAQSGLGRGRPSSARCTTTTSRCRSSS